MVGSVLRIMSVKTEVCCHGPGYASPQDAYLNGPREKYLFVACPHAAQTKPDRLVTIDVDPESPTYCSVSGLRLLHFLKYIQLFNYITGGQQGCLSVYW